MVDISKRIQWVDIAPQISALSLYIGLVETSRVNPSDISYTLNFVFQHAMADFGFEANFDAFLRTFPFWQTVFPEIEKNNENNFVESS